MKAFSTLAALCIGVTALITGACQQAEHPSAQANVSAPPSAAPPAVTADPHPPFGVLDTPRENVPVAGGVWGFGWALDDSGIAAVAVSFDGAKAIPAKIGQAFGGVKEAYPGMPGNERAGFIFQVPKLPAGPHSLTVLLVAQDGGRAELQRQFQIR